jgi:single-strand DNA-binding protein
MAVTVNRVIVAGNLTRDPQVRFLSNEKAVANFGLAINNRFKAADGTMKEDTVFVDIEAWGRTAELVGQYLTKGRSCLVEGRLKLDSWEKDGVKQSKLRVVADNVQFLDSGNRGEPRSGGSAPDASSQDRAPAPSSHAAPPPADDEPPF